MSTSPAGRAEEIAESLRGQILKGKYEPGERLPSERDLALRLGVHRSSVREALKKLEQLGMIAIRRGGGARVLPLERAGLGALQHALRSGPPDRELVAQWVDVYELVVAGAVRFAVERGTAEEFAEAKRLLRVMTSAKTSDEQLLAAADQLTDVIARASRNVVLRMVQNGLTSVAQQHDLARLLKVRASRKLIADLARDLPRALDKRDATLVEDRVRRMLRLGRELIIETIAARPEGN
jgi:GntR family transcriptional regulator, transcriptional repressor for pyruvate dehydrogenase complex